MDTSKVNLKDDEVVPILMREFTQGTLFPSDVFLRISKDKYLLVARQGEKTNLEQLHVVNQNDIEYLFVRSVDYKNCVGQNLSIAGILINKKEISNEKKAVFISKAMEGVFKEIEHIGINHETIEHTRMVASNLKTLVEAKPDLLSVVQMLSAIQGDLLRHSMAVGTISVMIAYKMGWTLQTTLEKIAMGALLHDIGLKELPKEILDRPRHELNYEERIIYETHPFRGAEILRSMPSITDDLISIVLEHHENAIGQGYPRRLRDFKMNPLAKVVALADLFCDLTFKHLNNPNPKKPEEAVSFIEITLGQPFNKQAFLALKEILGLSKKQKKQSA